MWKVKSLNKYREGDIVKLSSSYYSRLREDWEYKALEKADFNVQVFPRLYPESTVLYLAPFAVNHRILILREEDIESFTKKGSLSIRDIDRINYYWDKRGGNGERIPEGIRY